MVKEYDSTMGEGESDHEQGRKPFTVSAFFFSLSIFSLALRVAFAGVHVIFVRFRLLMFPPHFTLFKRMMRVTNKESALYPVSVIRVLMVSKRNL